MRKTIVTLIIGAVAAGANFFGGIGERAANLAGVDDLGPSLVVPTDDAPDYPPAPDSAVAQGAADVSPVGPEPGQQRVVLAMQDQAFARPAFVFALLEGNQFETPDAEADRRYANAFGISWERACVFEAAAIDTVGFRQAREQYAAPLKSASHVRLAGTLATAAGSAMRGLADFAADLSRGEDYAVSASAMLRRWQAARRALDLAGSVGSEDGARDAVRAVSFVGGCGQPDGLRLLRSLQALYASRAASSPTPSAPVPQPSAH